MSSNRQQNTMCTICCKFKWNSSLKLHISLKHNKPSITLLHEKERQHHGNLMLDSQHNNEPIAEGSKVEELEDSLVTNTANLKLELQRNDVNLLEVRLKPGFSFFAFLTYHPNDLSISHWILFDDVKKLFLPKSELCIFCIGSWLLCTKKI